MKKIYYLVMALGMICIISVLAWTPPGDIDLQKFYKIINGTNISSDYFIGSGKFLTELSLNASNVTSEFWVNETGDTMTGDLNMSENKLTDVGELIVTTITLKGNLTPYTDGLYNIGNSSNWIEELWVKNIYAHNINTTNLTTENLDATKGDVNNLTSEQMNIGKFVIKNTSQDLILILE